MEDQPEFADSLCQRTTAEHPRKPQGPGTRALPPVTMLTGIQAHPTGGDSAEILVAIDVGTSGARAAAYDVAGRLAGEVRRSYPTNVGSDGRAEQDANRWRSASPSALEGLVRELGPKKQIRAIGLTGQCPSVVPLDGRDRPLRPGLIYRDNRAAAEALEIRRQFGDQAFHQRTGHLPAAFHVAAKIVWMRHHEPALFEATRRFVELSDYVALALTGENATDWTVATASALFNVRERRWDEVILEGLEPFTISCDVRDCRS